MAVLLSFALVGFSSNSEAQEAEMLAGFQQHCDNSDSACVIENDTVPFWLVGAVASCLPLLISPRSVLNAVISRWLPAAFPTTLWLYFRLESRPFSWCSSHLPGYIVSFWRGHFWWMVSIMKNLRLRENVKTEW